MIDRQPNRKPRTLIIRALEMDRAVTFSNDLLTNVEPQPCSLTCRFGSEERFEDPGLKFVLDTAAIVPHHNFDLIRLPIMVGRDADLRFDTAGDSIARIQQQV